MKHDYNCLNPKFVLHLLEFLIRIFDEQGDNLTDVHISKWGVHDDFIFSEYFYDYCEELLPCERKALMHITRAIVVSSAEAYHELITNDYYGYEDYSKSPLLDELHEEAKRINALRG